MIKRPNVNGRYVFRGAHAPLASEIIIVSISILLIIFKQFDILDRVSIYIYIEIDIDIIDYEIVSKRFVNKILR